MLGTKEVISVNEMIVDISQNIYDEEFKKLGRGHYKMLVHRAVEKLAIDSFYNTITKDIYNWNVNRTFIVDMPANAFNLKDVILFNSTCKPDHCTCDTANTGYPTCWGSFTIAHYKANYNRFGTSGIQTAHISDRSNRDPVYETMDYNRFNLSNSVDGGNHRNKLVFFGDQDGSYCFSDNADTFKNIRLIYNGMGVDSLDAPSVPRVFRDAIIDKCVERALFRLKIKYPEYRTHWMDSMIPLFGDSRSTGSWALALRLAKRMDKKKKEDYKEYFGNMYSK